MRLLATTAALPSFVSLPFLVTGDFELLLRILPPTFEIVAVELFRGLLLFPLLRLFRDLPPQIDLPREPRTVVRPHGVLRLFQ